jgi:hypothetical protein
VKEEKGKDPTKAILLKFKIYVILMVKKVILDSFFLFFQNRFQKIRCIVDIAGGISTVSHWKILISIYTGFISNILLQILVKNYFVAINGI